MNIRFAKLLYIRQAYVHPAEAEKVKLTVYEPVGEYLCAKCLLASSITNSAWLGNLKCALGIGYVFLV